MDGEFSLHGGKQAGRLPALFNPHLLIKMECSAHGACNC
jgi:hypothetical protein